MKEMVTFRQIWSSHNGRHEGGRATHASRTLTDPNEGDELVATMGDVRNELRARLYMYVDCGRCLRILERA
jgi:hypothetical protein